VLKVVAVGAKALAMFTIHLATQMSPQRILTLHSCNQDLLALKAASRLTVMILRPHEVECC
jgi:hypothetical protein